MATTLEEKVGAFEQEALPELHSVYRVAHALTGDRADAEDLVQETMLKAYRSWDRFQSGTNVRAWLLTILRNTFISEYRRRRNHGHVVELVEIEGHAAFAREEGGGPEESYFDGTVDQEVTRAINALPLEHREPLVLRDVEGLSYGEIERIMDVPVGTVKSRLFRARQALRPVLFDYAAEMGYIQAPAPKKADEGKSRSRMGIATRASDGRRPAVRRVSSACCVTD